MMDSLEVSNADLTKPPQHNIAISIPRTASNLLTHLLALPSQPSIISHPRDGYFFLPALSFRFMHDTLVRPCELWSDSEKKGIHAALAKGSEGWDGWVTEAERKGKGTFVKEHVNWMIRSSIESMFLHDEKSALRSPETVKNEEQHHSNPTVVSDAFWSQVRPTFLIRHPALTFPSALRTSIDNEGLETTRSASSEMVQKWECTYRWHILLYRFIISQQTHSDPQQQSGFLGPSSNAPIILDASDLTSPALVQHYAELVGLDPTRVRTAWEATGQEEQEKMHSMERRMKDTLLASTSVLEGKLDSAAIDIAAEKRRWEVEFGTELAGRLDSLVEDAMTDYEWLRERRLNL
ncbi:hypothetical protein N0V95_001607 [Ascochyta clinopodiicola]|nr:hypothetical protein N0V95_001607 [Ascochyta clinopodiicola]